MSERAAFIRQICECPDDDVVRLVYADWLEEHGENERSSHIRWAVTNPQNSVVCLCGCKGRLPNPCEACQLFGEEVAPIPRRNDGESHYVANRGFVNELRIPCAAFMENAARLFREYPITSVRLMDKKPGVSPHPLHRELASYFWLAYAQSQVFGYEPSPNVQSESDRIPEKVFSLLSCQGKMTDNRYLMSHCRYLSVVEANDDLSLACVAYGRNLAGLPPLPRPEVGVAAGGAGG